MQGERFSNTLVRLSAHTCIRLAGSCRGFTLLLVLPSAGHLPLAAQRTMWDPFSWHAVGFPLSQLLFCTFSKLTRARKSRPLSKGSQVECGMLFLCSASCLGGCAVPAIGPPRPPSALYL